MQHFQEAIQTSDDYRDIARDCVEAWYNSEVSILPADCLSDQEIIDIVSDKNNHEIEGNSINEDFIPTVMEKKISIIEALSATNTLIKYSEQNITSKETLSILYTLKGQLIGKS